jgi:oxygen-independent coproporphyrinogen-3 oxidase
VDTVEEIDRRLEMAETMMMGLRLDTGISVQGFKARFSVEPAGEYGRTIKDLESLALLETVDGSLRLTPRGRIMGNEVFGRFFE